MDYNHYEDVEDYHPTNEREAELQDSIFQMREMMKQLNEAKDEMKQDPRGQGGAYRGNWDRRGGFRGRGRGGRGRGGRGRGGRGRWMPDGPPVPLLENYNQRENYVDFRGGGRGRVHNYRGAQHPGQYHPEHRNPRNDYSNQQSPSRSNEGHEIMPQFLVETLANCPGFSCSLLQLLETRNMHPSSVRNVALRYPDVFVLSEEALELKPQIKICPEHCGSNGCKNSGSCDDIHICDRYINEWCHERNCMNGHKWRTGHNDPVLRRFFIERLPFPTLRKLLQSTENVNSRTSGPLGICDEYNSDGCTQRNCASLHICLSFVNELTRCKINDCQLNHDLLTPSCCQLLGKHGIDTNEAPRDVLVALLENNPSLGKEVNKVTEEKKSKASSNKKDKISNEKKTNLSSKSTSRQKIRKNTKIEISDSSDSEESSSAEENKDQSHKHSGDRIAEKENISSKSSLESDKIPKTVKSPSKIGNSQKPETRRTLWSHYLQGDVSIPEICFYSVENICRYEGSGCQRLHSIKHFHWQIKDQSSRWFNLRPEQVRCLEYAYCDPSKDSANLPRLDPSTLEYSVSGLFILMGRDAWQADFKKNVVTNASNTKTLDIRRLTTETIDGQTVEVATFVWYFLDKNHKWVQYGNVDTAGASHLVSNITSKEIETQFLQNSASSLPFKNSRFTYLLDFKTMTQMNTNTRAIRKVVRRPFPHLQNEEKEEEKKTISMGLPDEWEKMETEERMRLVSLAPTSQEYMSVVNLLKGKVSKSQVLKVQRIQNPYLWRALENKITDMTAVYKDASKVNIKQLFHGTRHDIVANICAENFDWRLHGSRSGQSFGRGTYFAAEADYSYSYASPDSSNMRYIFVARVAVGATTRGDSSMVRPPTNPATSMPFDTTVNSVSNPSIFVKYDKQEYYPQYLLILT